MKEPYTENVKVFVPLGTQKFQFNRLIEALNGLVREGVYGPNEIIVQSAVYETEPLFIHLGVIDHALFDSYIRDADIVITHSGVNSIMTCMNLHKRLIIAPRLKEMGEHVDNHQVEIASVMERKYGVTILRDMSLIKDAIDEALKKEYRPWHSGNARLVDYIKSIID